MRTMLGKAIRDESGKILIMVLVLLVVGGLVLTPLLGLMSTGLVAGQVYEKKASELYAADAGVEDAIWRIKNNKAEFEDDYCFYPDPNQGVAELWVVNEKSVDVQIYQREMPESTQCRKIYRYRILSTATGHDGSATTVEAFLGSVALNYSGFPGNAITSGADITIQPVSGQNQLGMVCGNILLPATGVLNPANYEPACGGNVTRGTLEWPDAGDLAYFYNKDNLKAKYYTSGMTVDLDGVDQDLGPLYVDGELKILNSSNTPATLNLTGTLYIAGNTEIGVHGKKNLTVNLNGNTIFVESSSVKPPKEAVQIADKCDIQGPGTIIAVGDIYFAPNSQIGGEQNPVLLISLSGTVRLQPGSAFYGSVNGKAGVQLQPNNLIHFPPGWEPFTGINFPGFTDDKERYSLLSWQIQQGGQ